MTDRATSVGVAWHDGCWIGAAFAAAGFVETVVADEIGAVWGQYGEPAERVVVGVPIGLVENGDPERDCDRHAREHLGARASAVVTPPSREATRRRRFPAARRVHERTTGGELSRSAFGLAPAIAAVDELLQEVPESRHVLRASRPELAFRAFADEPLEHEPDTAGGYAERMRVLAEHDHDAPPTVQSAAEAAAGSAVPIHAVLDALVLGYTARGHSESLQTLPADPPTDPTGLPIELVYRADSPL